MSSSSRNGTTVEPCCRHYKKKSLPCLNSARNGPDAVPEKEEMKTPHIPRSAITTAAFLILASIGSSVQAVPAYMPARGSTPAVAKASVGDLRHLTFGEAIYDYYLNKNLRSASRLLTAKNVNIFGTESAQCDMLLSDLYVAFGMSNQAAQTLSDLSHQDILSSTRNEVWFKRGNLQYHQGNYVEAERILTAPLANLPAEMDSKRRTLLANVLMSRSEFDLAKDTLAPVSPDTELGLYATYNMGVAYIRSSRSKEGVDMLHRVMSSPINDPESNALKDRAALAIGFNALQQQQPDAARDALVNIRLDGPFSNQALLGLGYAHFTKQDYKKSLAVWLELIKRSPADPSVQEAMLLAPRAYEELQAYPQALFGYKYASQLFRATLKNLEKAALYVEQSGWLASLATPLKDPRDNIDPMTVNSIIVPPSNPEAKFLYEMFASDAFVEGHEAYVQLDRMQALLLKRLDDLDAWQDMVKSQKIKLANTSRLDNAREQLEAAQLRNMEFTERYKALNLRVRQTFRKARTPLDVASPEALEKYHRLSAMESSLLALRDTPTSTALRERFRRVRGLLLWDIVANAPEQEQTERTDINDITELMNLNKAHVGGLQKLVKANQKRENDDSETRIENARTEIQRLQTEISQSQTLYADYLKSLAKQAIEQQRNKLNMRLAESHLDVARLQDMATSKKANAQPSTPDNNQSSAK